MSNKTISVTIPEEMLPAIDEAAQQQRRSRSGFVREALRQVLSGEHRRLLPVDDAATDEARAIRRGRSQFDRGEFVRLEDLQRELGLPPR